MGPEQNGVAGMRGKMGRPTEGSGVDPVALALALWLGMVASAGGVMRLLDRVAAEPQFSVPVQARAIQGAAVQADYFGYAFGG